MLAGRIGTVIADTARTTLKTTLTSLRSTSSNTNTSFLIKLWSSVPVTYALDYPCLWPMYYPSTPSMDFKGFTNCIIAGILTPYITDITTPLPVSLKCSNEWHHILFMNDSTPNSFSYAIRQNNILFQGSEVGLGKWIKCHWGGIWRQKDWLVFVFPLTAQMQR